MSLLIPLPLGGLSLGILAAESNIISLGGGAGKQLYQLDEQRIGRGSVIPRFFCLPILLTLAHATNLGSRGASFPRGILAQNRHCLSTVPARRRGSAPRRPGAHQPIGENAPDVLQIDQRIAALERARCAAIQIVSGLAEQAPQLAIAEGLKC
jgi:hypothetical protein